MSNDLRLAKELCRVLGVAHIATPSPENQDIVGAEIAKNELTNFQVTEHGWAWLVAQSMADSNAVTYDGIAGDVLSAGHFHDDNNSRLYRAGAFDELAHLLAPFVRLLVPAHFRQEAAAADPYGALVRELRRYRDTHNPMMFFFLYNRSRRAVSVSVHGLWGNVSRDVYVPFPDKEVFDFLAGLPEEMFADKNFHSEAIARAHPEVGELAYVKKTPIPRELYRRYARQGLPFAMRASSPLLDRPAAFLRLARSLAVPRYEQESLWVLHQAVMLHQLGCLQIKAQ